jgi:hypothetical protein
LADVALANTVLENPFFSAYRTIDTEAVFGAELDIEIVVTIRPASRVSKPSFDF